LIETEEPATSVAPARAATLDIPLVKLRRLGVIAAAVVLLIAAAGIAIREWDARAVAQWTSDQALPTVSVVLPQRAAAGA